MNTFSSNENAMKIIQKFHNITILSVIVEKNHKGEKLKNSKNVKEIEAKCGFL